MYHPISGITTLLCRFRTETSCISHSTVVQSHNNKIKPLYKLDSLLSIFTHWKQLKMSTFNLVFLM